MNRSINRSTNSTLSGSFSTGNTMYRLKVHGMRMVTWRNTTRPCASGASPSMSSARMVSGVRPCSRT
nr:MAG: hypothetical protein [Apis mellifera filamentous virus]